MTPRLTLRREPFNPDEMQKRVDQLKKEGRMPTPEQFLEALAAAVIEEETERKT